MGQGRTDQKRSNDQNAGIDLCPKTFFTRQARIYKFEKEKRLSEKARNVHIVHLSIIDKNLFSYLYANSG